MSTTLKRNPLLWVTLLLLTVAIGAMALIATAGTARAGTGPSVTPTQKDGNPTCKTLLSPQPAFEIKIDPPKSGTYGPVTVNFHDNGTQVDFTSTVPVLAVFVKGGNDGGNLYDYRPLGSSADNNLVTPTGPQGQPQGISHVSFCWDSKPENPPEALTASKTAVATYDHTIKWDLTKTVTPAGPFSGVAGDTFNATWNVDATKTATDGNFKVTGVITINNPNDQDVGFDVTDTLDDGTMADVDCDSATAGNQASGTVSANGTATCDYTALPTTKDATSNNVQVSSTTQDVPGATALADVNWKANVVGDDSVTLADARFLYTELISASTTKTFPETFTCPTDRAAYDANNLYTKTFTNTATLKGAITDLTKSASVKLNCRYPWQAETATGAGTRYPNTSNWFMYTAFTTTKVDLIAGQKYDAGDITMARSGANTTITVTLGSGFRFANVKENLKIQDFANAPTKYLEPGQFKYKFTVPQFTGSQPTLTYTATIPGNTAKFYGIHANVERFVP